MRYISKSSVVLFCMIFVVFSNFSVASAVENYHLKGAAYNSYITDDLGRGEDIGKSTVVVTASTVYDGRSTGKEKIRVWTRDAIVANHFGAYSIYPHQIQTRLSSPNNVVNLITNMSPSQSTSWNGLGAVEWFVDGVWGVIYELAKAIANDLIGGVAHSKGTNSEWGIITFRNMNSKNVELPSTVGYKDGHSYYDGKYNTLTGRYTKSPVSRGVVGWYTFSYLLDPGKVGQIRASARAWYDMRIDTGHPSYPLIMGAYTGWADVNHTLTGR